jgi:hypothetical protein
MTMALPATQSVRFNWVLRFSSYKDKFRVFRIKWELGGSTKSSRRYIMITVALRAKLWKYWRYDDELAITFSFIRVHIVSFY